MGKGSPGRRKGLHVSGRQGTGAELGACRPRVAYVRSLGCLAWAGQWSRGRQVLAYVCGAVSSTASRCWSKDAWFTPCSITHRLCDWAGGLTFLGLSFLFCKMGIMIVATS